MSTVLFLTVLGIAGSGESGYPYSPQCRWFGASIGITGQAWMEIANGGAEAAIRQHCEAVTCSRAPRKTYALVYERMPCDKACYRIKVERYRKACTQQGG
ncbi:MAG: hypothetical protein HQL50_03115 [Magnetococcales bacterium]|nr:hypothetical protein [Magnetococcales bacterium]